MSIAPKLADGESFVAGRSTKQARELIEAAEAAGIDVTRVVTVSHGYVVPSELLEAVAAEADTADVEDADADADADADEADTDADADADEADAEADESEEVEEDVNQFDPSEANVVEVKAYLDGADEDERERVLAAEATGKNRSGVLSYTSEESK